MTNAIRVELLKLTRSLVGLIATAAIVLGVITLLAGITAGIANGNPELIAKTGPAAARDWEGLLRGAVQITAVAAILGFGIVVAWMFAREFTDGTITGLFALPVSRSRLALAKLAAYALWVGAVTADLIIAVLLLGALLGYGTPDASEWAALGRLAALSLLSAGIAIPIAWIATLTRSLLAAVGATVALVVIAQVGALAGAGAWLPLAAPALWAMTDGDSVSWLQLSLTVVVASAGVLLTCTAWSRLQLDR